MDASWWTGKDSNPAFKSQTNSPDPQNETFVFANNKIYSDATTPSNWCLWCWSKDTLGASNQFLPIAQAPALNTSLPIAWNPPTTRQALSVTMNGVEDDCDQWVNNPNNPSDCGFPQVVLWWNGQPLTPAPVVIRANQWATPPQEQTLTYQVPVIAGVPNFLSGFFANPGCCILQKGQNVGGRRVNWQTAKLGFAPVIDVSGIGVQGAPPVVFAAQSSDPPPVDTTSPMLAPATLTLAAGSTATVVLRDRSRQYGGAAHLRRYNPAKIGGASCQRSRRGRRQQVHAGGCRCGARHL